MFEKQTGTKQGDPLSSLLFNTVLQMALKDDVERRKKAKDMGIRLGDHESACLTHLRFADDVLLFSTSLVQLQKMMCDFKQSTESVGLKIHPDKTKILSNQSTNKRNEVEVQTKETKLRSTTAKLRYYLRRRVRNILGKNYISATGNSRDQKPSQSGLGILQQIQTRADIKIELPTSRTPLIQHGDHADAELCPWNLETIERTRENDTITSTQNASTCRPNKVKIKEESPAPQKRGRKRRRKSKPQKLR